MEIILKFMIDNENLNKVFEKNSYFLQWHIVATIFHSKNLKNLHHVECSYYQVIFTRNTG